MAERSRKALEIVYDGPESSEKVDIIAVHGLGARVDWTWTWKDEAQPGRLVNWLRDEDMLPAKVPSSRIILYNYDSRWHFDAPKTRLQLCGETLIREVSNFQEQSARRPIIFIGHSLGGNVIQHGLLYAYGIADFKAILSRVRGLIFLGSPFRGTKFQFLAQAIASIAEPVGSNDDIIKDLTYDSPTLRDKLHLFARMIKSREIETTCFFESYQSDVAKWPFFKGLAKGMIVEETSACIDGINRLPLQTDHSKLNKFSGPNDRSFSTVSHEIVRMFKKVPVETTPEAQAFLRDLCLSDPWEDLEMLKGKKGNRASNTCSWILETDFINAWLQHGNAHNRDGPPDDVFWLYGNPGTGKSTMSIFLAEELPERAFANKSIMYFFCDSSYDTRNTATAIIRGLLWKLLKLHPTLLNKVMPRYMERGAQVFNSFYSVWNMFLHATSDASTGMKYCIVDALDECDPQSQDFFLKEIEDTFGEDGSSSRHVYNLRFLLTSRPYPEIREVLKVFTNQNLNEFNQSRNDIEKFIQEKVSLLTKKKEYPDEVAAEVSQILFDKAEGTFLWVGLACAELRHVPSKDAVRRLHSIPKGLEQLYKSLLDTALDGDIDGRQPMQDALQFTVVAQQPLNLQELLDACQIEPGRSIELRLQFMRDVIDSCRLMVIIQNDKVLLLHQTIKDFLLKATVGRGERFIHDLKAHARLAARCVRRLIERDEHPKENERRFLLLFPEDLLHYSSHYWLYHAQSAQDEFRINSSEAAFFAIESPSREAWLKTQRLAAYTSRPTIFHLSITWNLPVITEHATQTLSKNLLVSTATHAMHCYEDKKYVNYYNQTPLELASESENYKIFQILLESEDTTEIPLGLVRTITRSAWREANLLAAVVNRRAQKTATTDSLNHLAEYLGHYGLVLIGGLLKSRGDKLSITTEFLKAVLRNTKVGHDFIALLLEQRANQICLTDEILEVGAGNEPLSDRILQAILDRKGDDFIISARVMQAIAINSSSGPQAMKLLLKRRGDRISITEGVLQAAATNPKSDVMLACLLDHKPARIVISDLVMRLLGGNLLSGRRAILLLLLYKMAEPPEILLGSLASEPTATQGGDGLTITWESIVGELATELSPIARDMDLDRLAILLDKKASDIALPRTLLRLVMMSGYSGQQVLRFLLRANSTEGILPLTKEKHLLIILSHRIIEGTKQGLHACLVPYSSPDRSTNLSENRSHLSHALPRKAVKMLPDFFGYEVLGLQFSNNGLFLVVWGKTSTAIIWDTSDWKVLLSLPHDDTNINRAFWSHDDSRIVTCDETGFARLWNRENGNLMWKIRPSATSVQACVWAADGESLIFGTLDDTRSLSTWSVEGQVIDNWENDFSTEIACGNDRWIAIADTNRVVHIYSTRSRELEFELLLEKRPLSLCPCGSTERLLLTTEDNSAIELDLVNRRVIRAFPRVRELGTPNGVVSFWGKNSDYIALAGQQKGIALWNRRTQERLGALGEQVKTIAMAWNPKHISMLASCGDEGVIRIWNDRPVDSVDESEGSKPESRSFGPRFGGSGAGFMFPGPKHVGLSNITYSVQPQSAF